MSKIRKNAAELPQLTRTQRVDIAWARVQHDAEIIRRMCAVIELASERHNRPPTPSELRALNFARLTLRENLSKWQALSCPKDTDKPPKKRRKRCTAAR